MKHRKDRGFLILHLALYAMAAIIVLALIMRSDVEEQKQYRKIKKEMLDEALPQAYKAHQHRGDICREVVLTSKGSRLKTRLIAGKGVLSLNQDATNVGFTEHLEEICCVMQEELYYEKDKPMQKVRLIQAHEANYDYSSNTLTTQEMNFSRFTIPSHELPELTELLTPSLTGKARTATITFKENGPEFHAQHLQVTLPHARVP